MSKTSTKLSIILLGYNIIIILLLTLNPFYLSVPDKISFSFHSNLGNLIGNILLFLPIGFFYQLATRGTKAIVIGVIISTSIEITQLFIPARTPSIVDIFANTLGAGFGAMIYRYTSTRLQVNKGVVHQFRLETPLTGLLYLLSSLIFINALANHSGSNRSILALFLGICGTIIISNLIKHWQVHSAHPFIPTPLSTGIWFILSASPSLQRPQSLLLICVTVILLAYILQHHQTLSMEERRFEKSTLRKVFPLFIFYIILLSTWNPMRPLTHWHWTVGFTSFSFESGTRLLIPRVEYLMAATVYGYLLAEWRSRDEIPLRRDIYRLAFNSGSLIALLEFVSGFQTGPGASMAHATVGFVGAIFGGMIFHTLRAHIRFLLNH